MKIKPNNTPLLYIVAYIADAAECMVQATCGAPHYHAGTNTQLTRRLKRPLRKLEFFISVCVSARLFCRGGLWSEWISGEFVLFCLHKQFAFRLRTHGIPYDMLCLICSKVHLEKTAQWEVLEANRGMWLIVINLSLCINNTLIRCGVIKSIG